MDEAKGISNRSAVSKEGSRNQAAILRDPQVVGVLEVKKRT